MILTLKIKLLPTVEQFDLLKETLIESNKSRNFISSIAFSKKVFNQFKLHKECYYTAREKFNLSAQIIVRNIASVNDSYKIDKKKVRKFKPLSSISYDSRILTYNKVSVSIWAIGGRVNIPFVCHNEKYLPHIKGETHLVFKKGKFYLAQAIEVPTEKINEVSDFIGVDFGLTDIAVTSDGKKHSAEWLNNYRSKKIKVRSSIQCKGTRSSKRLLKRLSGREKTTATIINHTISKSIVSAAKDQSKGVSIEDLTGIRFNSQKRNKTFKTKLGRWNFSQLRAFITYKSELAGVKLVVIDPRFTSQTCSECKHIGKRTNKVFQCVNTNCKVDKVDADFNAAQNISLLGASINKPERCNMYSCSVHR